jgi:hypothetical protein
MTNLLWCDDHECVLRWRAYDPDGGILTWPGQYVCPECEKEVEEDDDE